MLKRLVTSLYVLYVYFPHVALLRALGPHCAILLMRGLSYLSWCLSYVRGRNVLRSQMARVLPSIQPGLSIATALRRHYVLKQQFFVERQLFATARGRRFVARTYRNVEGREHLETARAAGRGVVIVSYHFDVCRMMYLALKELGYENYHHMIRETIHSGQAYGFIGRALVNKKTRDDAAGGVKIIYHQPGATFEIIAKLLQQGAIVGIAGDGMAGARFIEVPFLNGTLAFPTGPARLAARTGAPLVPAVCLLEGVFSHRVILYPPIYCQENSPASIEAAVRVYAGLLEEYVRRYPWSWWAWRRLRVREEPDGKIRFEVADESGEFDRRHGVRS